MEPTIDFFRQEDRTPPQEEVATSSNPTSSFVRLVLSLLLILRKERLLPPPGIIVTSSPTQSEIMSYPRLLSLITCLCLTSCGTIISLGSPGGPLGVRPHSEASVYRGTEWDLHLLNEGDPRSLFPLVLIDIPLCIAADTLLLPYDVYVTIRERNEELARLGNRRIWLGMNVVGFDGKPAEAVCLWLGTEKTDAFFAFSGNDGRASKRIGPGRYRVLITPRHKYGGGVVNKTEDREATDDERMTIMTIEISGYQWREIEVRLPKESGY